MRSHRRRLLSVGMSAAFVAGLLTIAPDAAPFVRAGGGAVTVLAQARLCSPEIQTVTALNAAGGPFACDNVVLPADEPTPPDGYTTNIQLANLGYLLRPFNAATLTIGDAELSGGGFCDPGAQTCSFSYSYAWTAVPAGTTSLRFTGVVGTRPGLVTVTDGEKPPHPIPATVDLAQGTVSFDAQPNNVFVQVTWFVGFADTVGSPFFGDINWLAAEGITGGCGGFRFCPKNAVTREQMASFLVRALDLPPTAEDFFSDDDSSIHEPDINRLAAAGITGGCGGSSFCPRTAVTRGQMASFLVRGLDLPGAAEDFFIDDETSIHEADINSVAAAGIAHGCQTDRFCPTSSVLREQMAAFLHRALGP